MPDDSDYEGDDMDQDDEIDDEIQDGVDVVEGGTKIISLASAKDQTPGQSNILDTDRTNLRNKTANIERDDNLQM